MNQIIIVRILIRVLRITAVYHNTGYYITAFLLFHPSIPAYFASLFTMSQTCGDVRAVAESFPKHLYFSEAVFLLALVGGWVWLSD